jgi:hypothetical protein
VDVNKIPTKSPEIYLADVYTPFAEMEGDGPDKTTVVIAIANESDNIKREDFRKSRRRSFLNAASPDVMVMTYEDDNRRALAAREVHLTLDRISNLTENGKPLFSIPPRKMPFDEFDDIWRELPSVVSSAIWLAVLQVNPEWSDD